MPSFVEERSSRSIPGVRKTESHQWLLRWTLWPTSTLSSADIVPNNRMFWNVRPIPSAVTWCGLRERIRLRRRVTIGLPSKMISPVVGT